MERERNGGIDNGYLLQCSASFRSYTWQERYIPTAFSFAANFLEGSGAVFPTTISCLNCQFRLFLFEIVVCFSTSEITCGNGGRIRFGEGDDLVVWLLYAMLPIRYTWI